MKYSYSGAILLSLLYLVVVGFYGIYGRADSINKEIELIKNEVTPLRLLNKKHKTYVMFIKISLPKGWDTYWKASGSAGQGAELDLIENKGINIKNYSFLYPLPQRLEILGIDTIGYKDKVFFPVIIEVADIEHGISGKFKFSYYSCKNVCVKKDYVFSLSFSAQDISEINKKKLSDEYNRRLNLVPKYWAQGSAILSNLEAVVYRDDSDKKLQKDRVLDISFSSNEKFQNLDLMLENEDILSSDFALYRLEDAEKALSYGIKKDDDKRYVYILRYQISGSVSKGTDYLFRVSKDNLSFKPEGWKKHIISDALVFEGKIENIKLSDKEAVPILGENLRANGDSDKNLLLEMFFVNKSIWYYILISVLGGLLLNLMPCVLPILSTRGYVRYNNKGERFLLLLTSLGIVSSFVGLGILIFAMKFFDIFVSLGIQYQNKYFMILLIMVMGYTIIDLLGIGKRYRFYISDRLSSVFLFGDKRWNSFISGISASVFSLSCAGPFVGSSLFFAFNMGLFEIILLSFFLGIGMSMPYLLLFIEPKLLLIILPKSRKWGVFVNRFFLLLSMVMFAWFSYLLYDNFMMERNTFKVENLEWKGKKESKNLDNARYIDDELLWEDFSLSKFENVPMNVARGKKVLLNITANWCLICQYNDYFIFNSSQVREFLRKNDDIILIRGDWSRANKDIEDLLRRYNHYSLPFTMVFTADYPQGKLLSEVLTVKELLNYL